MSMYALPLEPLRLKQVTLAKPYMMAMPWLPVAAFQEMATAGHKGHFGSVPS